MTFSGIAVQQSCQAAVAHAQVVQPPSEHELVVNACTQQVAYHAHPMRHPPHSSLCQRRVFAARLCTGGRAAHPYAKGWLTSAADTEPAGSDTCRASIVSGSGMTGNLFLEGPIMTEVGFEVFSHL